MAIEYDLVILGGTPEGVYAAERAVWLGARVALILHGLDGRRSHLQTHGVLHMMQHSPRQVPTETTLSPWQWMTQRAALIADTLIDEDWQRLAVQGCDVIDETGQITGDRPLKIETSSRRLTTRAVLIATGSQPQMPSLVGLETVPYETPESMLQGSSLPQSVVILGGVPLGLALSQLLRRWGVAVTLLTANDQLLGQEDADVSQWMTSQLRAEGVNLKVNGVVVGVSVLEGGGVAVKLSEESLTADTLVVAANAAPNLMGLGLEPWLNHHSYLGVNPFLQTKHPRIFACGTVLGGYQMPTIAQHEARIAITNALFWNRRHIDYRALPYDLPTQPTVARVGLTESQARQRYGDDELLIVCRSLYDNPKAQWYEATVGFCKVIAHRRGAILGVHGVGPEANEWVQAMAWLMGHSIPWWQLAQQPTLPDSLMALLQQTVQGWDRDRWRRGQWRRNWAENWYNWRRSP